MIDFRRAFARSIHPPEKSARLRRGSHLARRIITPCLFLHLFSTTWISEVCRRAGPAARRTGAERAGELTATVAELAPTAARRAPSPAATRPSDSLGWPDGPRGTLAAPGFPFCFSRENLLACPINGARTRRPEVAGPPPPLLSYRRRSPASAVCRSSVVSYSEVPRLAGIYS